MITAVIIPVFGKQELTHAVIKQLVSSKDEVDIYVIDNKGDYEPFGVGSEIILTPKFADGSPCNLRWTKGTNFGLENASACFDYDSYLLLNNDVVLSEGFLEQLGQTLQEPQVGLCGPLYDDVWPQQLSGYMGPASGFQGAPGSWRNARFVDGTAMLIKQQAFEQVGYLDEEHFGEYGWGSDIDYCYRARQLAWKVAVSEGAYMNHLKQQTAKTISNQWEHLAGQEMNTGMHNKYGSNWRELVY